MYEILHEANKHRGVFASSLCQLDTINNKTEVLVEKTANELKYDTRVNMFKPHYNYFVGHVQAPTSKKQTWDENTSHPFETEDWLVAHNGVITNYTKLNDVHCEWNENPVDTSVIVNMIQNESYKALTVNTLKRITEKEQIKIISWVCSQLEGSFACFIINKETSNVYLVRQGSTLFYNKDNFSSVAGINMEPVPEGKILKLVKTTDGKQQYEIVGKFKSKSPFFTL